jgi:hypothetical protein
MTTSLVISQPVSQQYVLLLLISYNLTSNSLSGNGCNNRMLTRRRAKEPYHERFWAWIEREYRFLDCSATCDTETLKVNAWSDSLLSSGRWPNVHV